MITSSIPANGHENYPALYALLNSGTNEVSDPTLHLIQSPGKISQVLKTLYGQLYYIFDALSFIIYFDM